MGDRAGLKAPTTVDVEATATPWEPVATEGFAAHMTGGPIGLASDLRNREKVLGTRIDSRRDLRIRYTEPASSPPAGVTNLDHYRDL